MCDTIDIRDITVSVHPHKVLLIRDPRGVSTRKVFGPATLTGQYRRVRVPHGEPELWIIFPAWANYGLNPDDMLNAHWDKIATLTKKNRAGKEYPLIR